MPKCTAHRSSTGEPCRAWALKGSTVCGAHGGSAPSVKAAAARRQVEERARRALPDSFVPVTDPLTALAELAGEITTTKDVIRGLVTTLEGTTDRLTGHEDVRAAVALYERALDRSERVLVNMAKLNIDDRLARIREQQIAIFGAALRWAVEEMRLRLELPDRDVETTRQVLEEMLGRLDRGEIPAA